jgi:hypothetical protein
VPKSFEGGGERISSARRSHSNFMILNLSAGAGVYLSASNLAAHDISMHKVRPPLFHLLGTHTQRTRTAAGRVRQSFFAHA